MALMKLGDIATAIFDRLRLDARTSSITWQDGRRTTNMMQKFPAGAIAVAEGEDVGVFVPVGRESLIKVSVAVIDKHEVVGQAEKNVQNLLDKVLEVLTTTAAGLDAREIQASPMAVIERISFLMDAAPEAAPPEARVIFSVEVQVHLH